MPNLSDKTATPTAAPVKTMHHDATDDSVTLRRLTSSENGLFLGHLQRLDPEARRLRFGHHVGEGFLKSYAARSLSGDTVVEALFVNGVVRGVAELRFVKADRHQAEAAFSVEKRYQGRGFGSRLFAQAVNAARNRGVRCLDITYLRENARIMALAKKHGATIRYEGSEVIAELPPKLADFASLRDEWQQETQALTRALFERRMEDWQRWGDPFSNAMQSMWSFFGPSPRRG